MLLDPTNRADYRILTAMRGPDNESGRLKKITAAVIRYHVGMHPVDTPPWYNGALSLPAKYALIYINTLMSVEREGLYREIRLNHHYIEHALAGLHALAAKPEVSILVAQQLTLLADTIKLISEHLNPILPLAIPEATRE